MGDFDYDLFSCEEDFKTCFFTCICPTIVASQNWAESRDEPCSICHFLAPVHPVWIRSNIRRKYGQTDNHYAADCLTYLFCFHCATCQDSNNLKKIRKLIASPIEHSMQHEYHSPPPEYSVNPSAYNPPSPGYSGYPPPGSPPYI